MVPRPQTILLFAFVIPLLLIVFTPSLGRAQVMAAEDFDDEALPDGWVFWGSDESRSG